METGVKGLGSSEYGPTSTNPNMVEYIGRQGCHHLLYMLDWV